jgi:transposase
MNAPSPPPLHLEFLDQTAHLVGPAGTLAVPDHDEITRKLFMLAEGQCAGLGASAAAEKSGFSRPRYYQLLSRYQSGGAAALQNLPRGPKTNYRRPEEVIKEVVHYRYLDRDASAAVIGQRLRQSGHPISTRSVERAVAEWGPQKKTPHVSPRPLPHPDSNPAHQAAPRTPARRPPKPPTGRSPDAGR